MLPRRFRTRLLAGLLLIGACLFIGAYYVPDRRLLRQVRQPRLWTLLWSSAPDDECPPVRPREPERWNTADIYPNLPFDVPDNGGMGFWNDALEGRYREIRSRWKDLPLKVIVVPHAHVDAGWLRTFDDYHLSFVTRILDNMVAFLNRTRDFAFVWSEVAFFAKWWERQSEDTRLTVKEIVARKQLEFVTGGWVMPDEAVTTYFGAVDQLVEGHQWLRHFVGPASQPLRGWSVDVFGHSASYAHVLSAAGISETVIMRTHYAWKRFLAESRSLDFYWEQLFPAPRVLCHMSPAQLYSFKHACGPDPSACLRFDFRRVDREYSESTADRITPKNVGPRAALLLSQYGRFASLFPHNVLLVPLGDDFRFDVAAEWKQQRDNYARLFDHINGNAEWNAHVQFGTVSDYFREVGVRMRAAGNRSPIAPLRSVEGDFLPYADAYADSPRPSYWTGFYTTRPFHKQLARELEYWLRTAEIVYSLAKTLAAGHRLIGSDYPLLVSARQTHALFQHHDAVTGTSKEFVMKDYCRKLHAGILDAMSIVSHATQLLLVEEERDGTWTSRVSSDIYRSAFDEPSRKLVVSVPPGRGGRKIILFNSLTVRRTEIVKVRITSPRVKVVDPGGRNVPFQVNPVFQDELSLSRTVFDLFFVASLKPLAFGVYTVVRVKETSADDELAKTVVSLSLNSDSLGTRLNSAFAFERPDSRDVRFESRKLRATFSHSGHLKSIHLKESGSTRNLDVDFLTYRSWMYRSGAYLFNPDGKAAPVSNRTGGRFPLLAVIRGPLVSELTIAHSDLLKFSVRLFDFEDSPPALQLEIVSDLSQGARDDDAELVVRIGSGVRNSGGVFYTDSNGFQMLRRKQVRDLPVQGNYYPATGALFVQDGDTRLNVLLSRAHGVTAAEGVVEVMLDRRIHHDDGRGLGEGVVEKSREVRTVLWLLPESRSSRNNNGTGLTGRAFRLSESFQHPPTVLVSESPEHVGDELSFLERPWPRNVRLVNLRTLPSPEDYSSPSNDSLMIVHQRHDSCGAPHADFVDGFVRGGGRRTFSAVKVRSVSRTSLTGVSSPTSPPPSVDGGGGGGGSDAKTASSSPPPPLQSCKVTFGE